MLWHKAWLDTRWRFLLGLALLLVCACGTVVSFRTVQELAARCRRAPSLGNEALQQELHESLEMVRTFRGYAWSQWFAGELPALADVRRGAARQRQPAREVGHRRVVFAGVARVARAAGSARAPASGSPSCSCSRSLPSIAIAALAPLVGEQFAVRSRRSSSACARSSGRACSSASRCSSRRWFNDVWRPLLLTCLAAVALAAVGCCCPKTTGCSRRWPAEITSTAGRCRGRAARQRAAACRGSFTPPRRTSRGATSEDRVMIMSRFSRRRYGVLESLASAFTFCVRESRPVACRLGESAGSRYLCRTAIRRRPLGSADSAATRRRYLRSTAVDLAAGARPGAVHRDFGSPVALLGFAARLVRLQLVADRDARPACRSPRHLAAVDGTIVADVTEEAAFRGS